MAKLMPSIMLLSILALCAGSELLEDYQKRNFEPNARTFPDFDRFMEFIKENLSNAEDKDEQGTNGEEARSIDSAKTGDSFNSFMECINKLGNRS